MEKSNWITTSENTNNFGKWILGFYKPEGKIFNAIEGFLIINKDFHRIFLKEEDIEDGKFIYSVPSQNVAFAIEEKYYVV